MYDFDSGVGDHATSRTQSVWPCSVHNTSYEAVAGLKFQSLTRLSLPPVANLLTTPAAAPVCPAINCPGSMAGAQLTLFAPKLPCALNMT